MLAPGIDHGIAARPYDLHKVVRTQQEIANHLVMGYTRELMTPEHLAVIVEELAKMLRLTEPSAFDALAKSLLDLDGRQLDPKLAGDLAWRLAGNLASLRAGQPAMAWSRPTDMEWVPVQVREAKPGQRTDLSGNTSRGVWLRCLVLAGRPAGLETQRWWSIGYLRRWKHLLGFSKPAVRPDRWPPGKPFFPLLDVHQLTRMRFLALIDPEACKDGPSFQAWRCTGAHTDWNISLLMARDRDRTACPYGVDVDCHECSAGYDRCRYACRPTSLAATPGKKDKA